MTSIKYFGMAVVCFLIGVTSFYLFSTRTFEGPQITAPEIKSFSFQGVPFKFGSSLPESIMAGIQESVSRTMPGYEITRVLCTCPEIISNQQSYRNATLHRGPNSVVDVYLAEASSSPAAKKWMKSWTKIGTDRFFTTSKLEAIRDSRKGQSMIRIRIDRCVMEIGGDAAAVEALSQMVLQSPASQRVDYAR